VPAKSWLAGQLSLGTTHPTSVVKILLISHSSDTPALPLPSHVFGSQQHQAKASSGKQNADTKFSRAAIDYNHTTGISAPVLVKC
jgi:hypothetical protein